ncbi:hypothetical protein ASA1KI_01390 [Opitutales bacterium ASA1]|nr:hypothetical protein ASA1KI_01390 [Opitutales bacterium ASA1]
MRSSVFFSILGAAFVVASPRAALAVTPPEPVWFAGFHEPFLQTGWEIRTDRQVGGETEAQWAVDAEGVARFVGSLHRPGGVAFAHARAEQAIAAGLPETIEAFVVRVRGDGRRYMMSVMTADAHEGVHYRAEFSTAQGEWSTVRLPLPEFKPFFRAFWVAHGTLRPEQVRGFGFMVAGEEQGDFELLVDYVAALGPDGRGDS